MSESLRIDLLFPSRRCEAYSGDLRERVIEAAETARRREAAERFEVSVASVVK
jgi:hypothetical protein